MIEQVLQGYNKGAKHKNKERAEARKKICQTIDRKGL